MYPYQGSSRTKTSLSVSLLSFLSASQEQPGVHIATQRETLKLVDSSLEIHNWIGAAFCLDPFWVGQAHLGDNCLQCLQDKGFQPADALRSCIPMLATYIEPLEEKEAVFAFLEPFLDCRAPCDISSYPKAPMYAHQIAAWWKWKAGSKALQDLVRKLMSMRSCSTLAEVLLP